MEAIRKLREQVSKQQQAVLRQFSGRFGHESALADDVELQCHQKIQLLYNSTRAGKRFQRDIVRGLESLISVSLKEMEIVRKLAEDCSKYGNEHLSSGLPLAKASRDFGSSHFSTVSEREHLIKLLGDQVFEPLRIMIMGAPLEDARHLANHYERIRKDVEAQTAEVLRRQLKSKEVGASADSASKLQNEEAKLLDLKATLSALGREATAAMLSVETQQQEVTFQRLLAMVDAERSYHNKVAGILDKLHEEMVQVNKHTGSLSPSTTITNGHPQTAYEVSKFSQSGDLPASGQDTIYFIVEVIHPFDAQADGELSLSVGDYVVVRQDADNGWSEGECKGKAGWFPSAYVELRDKAPASKVLETVPSHDQTFFQRSADTHTRK